MQVEAEPASGNRWRARRAALGMLLRAFPFRTAVLGASSAVAGALPAVFALLVARLIGQLPAAVEAGLDSSDGRRVLGTLAAIGGVLVAQEVVSAFREVQVTDLYRRYDEYLLSRVMATTMWVPRLDLFDDPDLAARTDRAARIAKYGPGELVSGLSNQWTMRVQGLAAALLVLSVWPLAALVLVPIWIATGRFLRSDMYRANPFWAEPYRRASYLKQIGLMPEWAKELRIFGLTGWVADRYDREGAMVLAELRRARRVGHRVMSVLFPALVAANLGVLVFAARAALGGDLTLEAVAVLVQGLFGLAALASQQGDVWIENGAVPVPDVLDHEHAAAQRTPAPAPGALPATGLPAREIRFEGVRFTYPSRSTPVFDGLDLTIEAGQSLGVVGLNGAGKTTLIKLLTGLAIPQGGRITVDGIELGRLDRTGWRQAVAAIFQDFVHYPLPARDNIGFGTIERLHAPDAEERALVAATRAGADRVLHRLPNGVDTVLSRRYTGGVDLSGGQWQRIALARAMAAVGAGAQVLVLDEPTAQLDVRAEADLYNRFLDLTHGLTSIVISHRFSTVRRADRIVVLEHGRVVEDGTHDQLLAADGTYAGLFRTQARRYADGVGDG